MCAAKLYDGKIGYYSGRDGLMYSSIEVAAMPHPGKLLATALAVS